ncbi:roadblock/LC7 domain-containing protein [Streptomyces sp. RerS4]|uniref:roadblock/LC7 domain-containing protein n=1 Tax=Streptomyces sp. RerS4 TaxID=2942449 RepID=UPI00201C1AEC|nr:roadblock/LC7 domain-containing protein [Streptomyces sp. RerS4]UQW99736.1 roadblock/LC7 domain-containing protein [Streptomyces sp. RerS4]
MTASPSPLRPSALALLITAAVTGALSTAAVAAAPTAVQVPLGWFAASGSLLLAVAAFALTWSLRANRTLRRRLSGLTGELTARDAHIARLTADATRDAAAHTAERARLTAAHTAELDALTAAHAAELDRLTTAHGGELDGLATAQAVTRERLGEELRRARSGRAAAMAAAANAAGRMQALATGMLADLREMEHRHADEDVLTDLLHLDHRTAQAGRLADSIAVLAGARSGRRWAKPIVMESILRGAMGRIGGYQRVRLHSTSEAAVAGHAAEGVMHALAELLDNAANFSPPTAEVHVYVEDVPAGIVITVEDSGLVMSEVQLRRAEQAVTAQSLDLAGLSGTRLGLAVVGRLAHKHGLTVSFRPSARGGTGAILMLPQELISRAPAEALPAPALLAAPTPTVPRPRTHDARTEPAHTGPADDGRPPPAPPRTPRPRNHRPRPGARRERTAPAQARPHPGRRPPRGPRRRDRGGPYPGRPHRRLPVRRPLRQLPPGRTQDTGPAAAHEPPAPGRQHAMTGSTTDETLNWLLEGLLERTPGARHALVLSRDGLKLCRTPELSVDQADQLAAIAAGIQSLSHGASIEFGDGTGGVRSAMAEFYGGILFIVEAGEGAHLALVAGEEADAGLVGHNMSELVEQLSEHLIARPRG